MESCAKAYKRTERSAGVIAADVPEPGRTPPVCGRGAHANIATATDKPRTAFIKCSVGRWGLRSGNDCTAESHRSGLNRRPLDYESSALPLSYCGGGTAAMPWRGLEPRRLAAPPP